MRGLRPATIVILGGLLTGAAMGSVVLVSTPDARNISSLFIAIGVGTAFGALMFAPAAIAVKFRERIRLFLDRRTFHFESIVPIMSAVALGYLIASMRHQTFDAWSFVALGLVMIGAIVGTVVGIAQADRPAR